MIVEVPESIKLSLALPARLPLHTMQIAKNCKLILVSLTSLLTKSHHDHDLPNIVNISMQWNLIPENSREGKYPSYSRCIYKL